MFLSNKSSSFYYVLQIFASLALFMSVPSAALYVNKNGETVQYPLPERPAGLAKSAASVASDDTLDSVRALSEINVSSAADAYPFISGDGLRLYYIRDISSSYYLYYTSRPRRDTLFGPSVVVPGLSSYSTAIGCWLTSDELTIFFTTTDGTLYRASRISIASAFSTPQTVTLSGVVSGFKSAPSLTPDLNELYLYSSSAPNAIIRCVRATDYQYNYVENVAVIGARGTVAPGQLSKDGLKFYIGIKPSTSSYDVLYVFTRAFLSSPWDSGTVYPMAASMDCYQTSVTADEKELFFVSGGGSWTGNDLYIGKLKSYPPLQLVPIASPTYNRRPDFKWHRVPGATGYTLQIDSNSSFTSIIIAMPMADTVYSPQVDLPAGPMYWRVKADNTNYASSMFVILDIRVPMIIPYQPAMTLERRPVLRWHPVSGASTYTILIDDYYDFLTPIITVPIQAPDTSYTCLADLPYGTICWKVRSNLVPTFSDVDTFQVIPDTIPYLWRFNGAALSVPRPLFRWHPVPNSTSYTIDLSTTPTFTTHVLLIPVPDTTTLPIIDLANGKYYWRVSSSRNGIFSPIDSFSVSTAAARNGPGAAGKGGYCDVVCNRTGVLVHYALLSGQTPSFTLYNLHGTTIYAVRMERSHGVVSIPFTTAIPAGTYIAVLKAGIERYQRSLLLSR